MDASTFFWLFLIFTALQPVLHQRFLEASRRRQITRVEAVRKSRVILLVHRQETMSVLGFPVLRYINVDDSEQVIRAIHMTDSEMPLDLVLHTPGGLALASAQIARAVRDHKGKVTAFVPHYAMSGGTLIALAADEIVLCQHSVLGPVDPQVDKYPAASIVAAVEQKSVDEVDDHTLILADQARKALAQMQQEVNELLAGRYSEDAARDIARLLTSGTWTHDYAITFGRAQQLGLRVHDAMPTEILQLMELYPQPVRRLPSVEFVPRPYPRGGASHD